MRVNNSTVDIHSDPHVQLFHGQTVVELLGHSFNLDFLKNHRTVVQRSWARLHSWQWRPRNPVSPYGANACSPPFCSPSLIVSLITNGHGHSRSPMYLYPDAHLYSCGNVPVTVISNEITGRWDTCGIFTVAMPPTLPSGADGPGTCHCQIFFFCLLCVLLVVDLSSVLFICLLIAMPIWRYLVWLV